MAIRTLVIAPHPDDETLGCGGTLLKRKSQNASIAWLIITGIKEEDGWPKEKVINREKEIKRVEFEYDFDHVYNLKKPAALLDKLPLAELIKEISFVFNDFKPEEIFLPHWNDIHSDHRVTFEASIACSKSFRNPQIRNIFAYETLSETEFSYKSNDSFNPNYFIDISNFLEKKIEIISTFQSEISDFPFPRSIEMIRSLSKIRGSRCGCKAAESFQAIFQREK